MKTLVTLFIGCLLASCSTSPFVTESDTGRSYPDSHLDALRGMASGKRDAEAMRSADDIIATAGKCEVDDSGTTYPGTVKVMRWKHHGQEKYTALRLARWPGGFECWQGPTPPSGFYGQKLKTEYIH